MTSLGHPYIDIMNASSYSISYKLRFICTNKKKITRNVTIRHGGIAALEHQYSRTAQETHQLF